MTDEIEVDKSEDSLPNNVVELRPFKRPATWDDLVEGFEQIHETMTLVQEASPEQTAFLQQRTN